MDFDKPKVYGDTSITDGLVDSVDTDSEFPGARCFVSFVVGNYLDLSTFTS